MSATIHEQFDKLTTLKTEILEAIKADDPDDYSISIQLKEAVALNTEIVKEIQGLQKDFYTNAIQDYLNQHTKNNLNTSKDSIDNLSEDGKELSIQIEKLKISIVEKERRVSEQEKLSTEQAELQEKEADLTRKLAALSEVKKRVDADEVYSLEQEFLRNKEVYRDKESELNILDNQLSDQKTKFDNITQEINNKIAQKKYNDNLTQLENDLNAVIEDYETNYSQKKQQSVNITRYRIDFTKNVSGHLLNTTQYNKLDDMNRALDEMDDEIRTILMEQKNAPDTDAQPSQL